MIRWTFVHIAPPNWVIRRNKFSLITLEVCLLASVFFVMIIHIFFTMTLEEPPKKKLIERVREAIRLKHYSYRTEETYVQWIKRYIFFHNKRHPREMGVAEIESFLTHLAVVDKVAASTQNQALSALLFLYRVVLGQELEQPIDVLRAKPSRYLPTVLTPEEVRVIIQQLSGEYKILIQLLYGSGLRLNEGLNLRVKDIDFGHKQIVVRDAKGNESRVTMLPEILIDPLQS
jgi:integrase